MEDSNKNDTAKVPSFNKFYDTLTGVNNSIEKNISAYKDKDLTDDEIKSLEDCCTISNDLNKKFSEISESAKAKIKDEKKDYINDLMKKSGISIIDMIKKSGISIDEIVKEMPHQVSGSKIKEVKKYKNPPKYANPNNDGKTWCGIGKPPKWMTEYKSNGGNPDDLLINKLTIKE